MPPPITTGDSLELDPFSVALIVHKPAASTTLWLRLALLGVLACAVLGAFGFWWFGVRAATTQAPGRATTGPAVTTTAPVAVSERGLQTLAALGRAIYWAGPQPNDRLELTQNQDGRIYVRYLPPGMRIGSPNLAQTVASYPVTNAYRVTRDIAERAGSVKISVEGGIAFYRSELPTNVYVAFRGSEYQVEVFDPSPARAHELVTSRAIRQVEPVAPGVTVPKTAAVAADPEQLAGLATRLGRPLYWAGHEPGVTYELTQTPDGRVYVRYLPAGVRLGVARPFLTVGTYPLEDAYAATQAAAKQPGSVVIPVSGGIAFYSESRPTSVYLAYRGMDEQVEVYDPSAQRAHALVTDREIRSVS